MVGVRTNTIKKAARIIVEKYYPRLSVDFQSNKKLADEVAIIPSKKLRNRIAGYVTHLMKRIQRGPVRGISFKLQEDERERKDNIVPEYSVLDVEEITIDQETKDLLRHLEFANLPNVVVPSAAQTTNVPANKGRSFNK